MTKEKVTPKQELFCQHYSAPGELFGNAVKSYLFVFDKKIPITKSQRSYTEAEKKIYNTAHVEVYRILQKPHIKRRCNEILDQHIKHEVIDREMTRVAVQTKELVPKMMAIKEYNRVKLRVDEKPNTNIIIDTTGKAKSVRDATLEELANRRAKEIIRNNGNKRGGNKGKQQS